ncbi:MAG TPA: thioesterase family protein [Casimicrobiaceae bacterium]|nr:thioesterase family protein [Casimicrobiaceae bacterium]
MPEPRSSHRADYRHFVTIPTRWHDNDVYGHVNNVVYYAFFDTAVNEHLIRHGGLDVVNDPVVGYVVETSCRFERPFTFPEVVHAGLRVAKLGNASVVYEVGLFTGDEDTAVATGRFVHVWVERHGGRPARVPDKIRAALAALIA